MKIHPVALILWCIIFLFIILWLVGACNGDTAMLVIVVCCAPGFILGFIHGALR
jgi:hypothetical protein